jgi:VanZ family protein
MMRAMKSASPNILHYIRAVSVWAFWPAVALIVWGELTSHVPDIFFNIWDKALHFTAYFGLAAMAWMALGGGRRGMWSIAGLIVLGGVLEIIQGQVGRDMSIWDEVANALGASSGAFVAYCFVLALSARLVAPTPAD